MATTPIPALDISGGIPPAPVGLDPLAGLPAPGLPDWAKPVPTDNYLAVLTQLRDNIAHCRMMRFSGESANFEGAIIYSPAQRRFNVFVADGVTQLPLDLTGGQGARFQDGDAAAPGVAFESEQSTGMFRRDAGVIGFSGGGLPLMTIRPASTVFGNIGDGGFAFRARSETSMNALFDSTATSSVTIQSGPANIALLRLLGGTVSHDIVAWNGAVPGFTFSIAGTRAGQWGPAGLSAFSFDQQQDVSLVPAADPYLRIFKAGVSEVRLTVFSDGAVTLRNLSSSRDLFIGRFDGMVELSGGQFRITGDGRVGIGLNPTASGQPNLLQVSGTVITFGGGYRALNATNESAISITPNPGLGQGGVLNADGGHIDFAAGGANRLRLEQSGNLVPFGTTNIGGPTTPFNNIHGNNFFLGGQGPGVAGTFGFNNSNGPGMIMWGASTAGAGELHMITGGVTRLRIGSAGAIMEAATGRELGYKDVPPISMTANGWVINAQNRGCCMVSDTGNTNSVVGVATQGCTISVLANNGVLTLTPASGVTMFLAGTGLTGARTLQPNALATIWWVNANQCYISGAGVS